MIERGASHLLLIFQRSSRRWGFANPIVLGVELSLTRRTWIRFNVVTDAIAITLPQAMANKTNAV